MSVRRRLAGAAASAVGVAAAGAAIQVTRRRRRIGRRPVDDTPFGGLRSAPRTVISTDGLPLHVEVDEVVDSPLTVVFAHGFALNLDCWHFQRAALRGVVRTVFYDQRSHGRSGRSERDNATFEQLGRDLGQILDQVVPDGPVVVVGHSMGGMTIVALAEEYPELFGDRVVGVGLIATTAGGLDPSRILLPLAPAKLSGDLTDVGVRTLARGHRVVDVGRRLGRSIAMVAVDAFAFGEDVPASYVDFVDEMLSATAFEVVAEFFPSFRGLDKFHAVEVMSAVPTTVICGTDDKLTSIGHSRNLHSRIAGSELLECEGAGHMVILERHAVVNETLEKLVVSAIERTGGAGSR